MTDSGHECPETRLDGCVRNTRQVRTLPMPKAEIAYQLLRYFIKWTVNCSNKFTVAQYVARKLIKIPLVGLC